MCSLWDTISPPVTSTESPTKIFPFLKLPLEIRQYIYASVLPRQDIPMRSNNWVEKINNIPNQFMNILLANKQISHEAHTALYGSTTFTLAVNEHETRFLHVTQGTYHFAPFPSMGLIRYIKNWQLDLLHRYQYWHACGGNDCTNEVVLAASAELAQAIDLQTLKILLPCLCIKPDDIPTCSVYTGASRTLDPLRRLRFDGGVHIVAARPLYYDWTLPDAHIIKQCPRPECIAFANSFRKTRAIVEGDTLPPPLTSRQLTWFDLKAQISSIIASHAQLDIALSRVWRRMKVPEAEFKRAVRACLAAIREEWENQTRDGRLENYRRYERKGIHEEYWEKLA